MGGGSYAGTNAPSNEDLNAALSRLGSDPNQNMIEPGSGGAAYWYVDPRAQTPQQMQAQYDDEQGHTEGDTGQMFDIEAALSRLPQSQNQDISF